MANFVKRTLNFSPTRAICYNNGYGNGEQGKAGREEAKRHPPQPQGAARVRDRGDLCGGDRADGDGDQIHPAGTGELAGFFCRAQNGEVWVYNFYIAPYEQGNRYNVETRRPRKLLLHKWQIAKMTTRINERGLAIIPTKLFFERGYAKLEIGIGRGKKLWDKRDSIAERDRERDARREVFSRE